MHDIDKLIEYILEQLCDAEKYAKCSLTHRETDKTLADLYYNLAKEQLNHSSLEHAQVQRLLSDPKLEHEWMKVVWSYEKNRMIDLKANINSMLSMYKT